jgi:hypothetical protein
MLQSDDNHKLSADLTGFAQVDFSGKRNGTKHGKRHTGTCIPVSKRTR